LVSRWSCRVAAHSFSPEEVFIKFIITN